MKHRHHTEHENEQQKLMLTNKHTDVFISNENLFTCRGFLFCITANKPYIRNIKIFINITNKKKKANAVQHYFHNQEKGPIM